MADHSVEIARLEALLSTGARSISVDGVSTTLDPESIRQRLRQLKADDDAHRGRRPRITSMDLRGF